MQIQSIFMYVYIHIDTHRCCQNTEAERQKSGNIDSDLPFCITGVHQKQKLLNSFCEIHIIFHIVLTIFLYC